MMMMMMKKDNTKSQYFWIFSSDSPTATHDLTAPLSCLRELLRCLCKGFGWCSSQLLSQFQSIEHRILVLQDVDLWGHQLQVFEVGWIKLDYYWIYNIMMDERLLNMGGFRSLDGREEIPDGLESGFGKISLEKIPSNNSTSAILQEGRFWMLFFYHLLHHW